MNGSSPGSPREPWLAVNLSTILPGLGQFYTGRVRRGVGFLAAVAALFAGAVVTALAPRGSIWAALALGLLGSALAVFGLFDAHRCARLRNDATFESARRGAKDPWLAVFLSRLVFPGVGHLYLGRVWAGLLILLGFTAILVLVGMVEGAALIADLMAAAALALACLLAYRAAPVRRETTGRTIVVMTLLIGGFTLAGATLQGLFRARVIQAFRISSESMSPTLRVGDRLFVSKAGGYVPSRGDVVVLRYPPDPAKDFIERVVALPGDTLELRDRVVIVNGSPQDDSHAVHLDPTILPAGESRRDNLGPIVLGPREYFVMGDNRENSNDSRFWGTVERSLIRGRAFKIYWPPARVGPMR